MNIYYAKTVLYAYKSIDAVMEQIDELVENKALASISDLSPCEFQCEKILALTEQKDILIELKIKSDQALKEFSEKEIMFFDYKYFHLKPKEEFKDFDASCRNYFRTQIKLAEKFAASLVKCGIDDAWFTEKCMKIDFFKEAYKRVLERESACAKQPEKREDNGVNKIPA